MSRLRNVFADDDLTGSDRAWRVAVVVVFVALAAWVGARLWAQRGGGDVRGLLVPVAVLAGWTVAFWLVRGIGIIVDDHTLGFTLVHTALMVASIGLAVAAVVALRPPRPI